MSWTAPLDDQAYAIVIRQLESKGRREAVRRYQADHRSRITALKRLIRTHRGGEADRYLPHPHRAVQAGDAGGSVVR